MPDFDVAYLDLAIGLAVAFFLLSLPVSAIVEFGAFLTRIRSKFLWAYLNQLFTKKTGADAKTAGGAARFAVAVDTAGAQTGNRNAVRMPASSWDVVRLMLVKHDADPRPNTDAEAGNEETAVDVIHRQLLPLEAGSTLRRKHKTTVKYVPPTTFAESVVEVLIGADPAEPDVISKKIEMLKGSAAYPTLRTLWATTEDDLQQFRLHLERWFDAEMARLSGLYKRLTRWLVAIAAITVAIVVNVDPIALATDLWQDPGRRAQLVEISEALASSGATASTPGTNDGSDGDASNPPTGDAADAAEASELDQLVAACRRDEGDTTESPDEDEAAARLDSVKVCVVKALDAQREVGLLQNSLFERENWNDSWKGGWPWHWRPVKLALVALAIFLGAPFWFDVIRRLTGVRKYLVRHET